ncbi:Uncharacterized protein FWK35_00019751, partial [Aphis craccivora]
DLFPIVDLQHLAIVEEKLENKHSFNKYKTKMFHLTARNVDETVKILMGTIFCKNIAPSISFTGKGKTVNGLEKKTLIKMKIFEILKEVTFHKHCNSNIKELKLSITSWFKHATER